MLPKKDSDEPEPGIPSSASSPSSSSPKKQVLKNPFGFLAVLFKARKNETSSLRDVLEEVMEGSSLSLDETIETIHERKLIENVLAVP